MGDERVWNDESRDGLREALREFILGEQRLAKRGREGILEICREAFIQDECPENEVDTFAQFAADEYDRAEVQLTAEKATWPDETDCDRLDRVEAALRDRGILVWQVSPCCDTCSGAELPDRIEEVDQRYPGFHDRARGYAFFIEQTMPEMLAEGTHVSIYLAYGWLSPDDEEVAPLVYEKAALDIAREVCECLRDEGFEADWDGDFARKIGVSLDWKRRALLE